MCKSVLEQQVLILFSYLHTALAPISSAFVNTLSQKALTVALSLALRLVILPWWSTVTECCDQCKLWVVLCLKQHPPKTTSKIRRTRRARHTVTGEIKIFRWWWWSFFKSSSFGLNTLFLLSCEHLFLCSVKDSRAHQKGRCFFKYIVFLSYRHIYFFSILTAKVVPLLFTSMPRQNPFLCKNVLNQQTWIWICSKLQNYSYEIW